MGNIWYNEPKTLDVAFDVIGDIVLSAASQQYGGFTVPSADLILDKYAEKSYAKYMDKYMSLGLTREKAEEVAYRDVERDFEQGFQGWEYKFNTVASSRGDYPFITVTIGTGRTRFAKMASICMLRVRMNGQGKAGHKKPVLFPKVVFLYDENLHGPGKELEDVFEAGIECSSKNHVSGLAQSDRKGIYRQHVQEVRRDYQPHGLSGVFVALVREGRHVSGGRCGQTGLCGPFQYRRCQPASAHDSREIPSGEQRLL